MGHFRRTLATVRHKCGHASMLGALHACCECAQVLHSRDDCRTEYANSEALVARACSGDKALAALDGMAHMLLHAGPELTRAAVARMVQWMLARL